MPAFINMQQYEVEKALVDRVLQLERIDLRWKNRVTAIAPRNDDARLDHRDA